MTMRSMIVLTAAVIALAVSACGRDEPTIAPNPKGSATATGTVSVAPAPTTAGAEDVSGNCDEVEHANDATCQAPGAGEDDSGSSSGGGGSGSGGSSGSGYGS